MSREAVPDPRQYHADRRQARVNVATEVPVQWRELLRQRAEAEGTTISDLVRRGIALVLRGKANDREDRDVA